MKKEIELDESRVLEVQNTNLAIMGKAEDAAVQLEKATRAKMFGPDGEMVLAEAEAQGKEISRALQWWEDDFIGPVISGAHGVWKMLCDRRKVISDPLKMKKDRLALAVGAYRRAHTEDRLRREEEERRRLQKEEEDRRLVEAAELATEGKHAEADEVIEAPIYTPPVTYAAPAATKGVATKQNWKYRIINPALIPDEFWVVDESKLGAHVRLHKDKSNVPGIEVFAEDKAAFSSR